MTIQNSEIFRNLDRESYINKFLKANKLIMTEQNIKKYAKKSIQAINLQLNYLKAAKELKNRKTRAEEFEPQILDLIKSKKEELKQIQKQPSKRVTRTHKPSAQDNKLVELNGEIYNLESHHRALRCRIDDNFIGLSPKQDDMFYNYIEQNHMKQIIKL
jgi:hypothetical protein